MLEGKGPSRVGSTDVRTARAGPCRVTAGITLLGARRFRFVRGLDNVSASRRTPDGISQNEWLRHSTSLSHSTGVIRSGKVSSPCLAALITAHHTQRRAGRQPRSRLGTGLIAAGPRRRASFSVVMTSTLEAYPGRPRASWANPALRGGLRTRCASRDLSKRRSTYEEPETKPAGGDEPAESTPNDQR